MTVAALAMDSSSGPVTTKPGPMTSKSSSVRPDFARPASILGRVTSRRYVSVEKAWQMMPSQTSPATSDMSGPTAEMNTLGGPHSLGPGLKNGVIRVWV